MGARHVAIAIFFFTLLALLTGGIGCFNEATMLKPYGEGGTAGCTTTTTTTTNTAGSGGEAGSAGQAGQGGEAGSGGQAGNGGEAGSGGAQPECTPGDIENCTTECGTTGRRGCTIYSKWSGCVPPAEICNGIDDNCDGDTDENDVCATDCIPDETRDCVTSCVSTGTQTCTDLGEWGACDPPAETCNGLDDDCDGVADNGTVCCVESLVCEIGNYGCSWIQDQPVYCLYDPDGPGGNPAWLLECMCPNPDDGNKGTWLSPGTDCANPDPPQCWQDPG
jgi:hypothetical protein